MRTYYSLTLVITAEDLAEEMGCKIDEINSGDYIGTIRDFGVVTKIEEFEE